MALLTGWGGCCTAEFGSFRIARRCSASCVNTTGGVDVFSGHWLRCDIPLIETEAEFVLYTDIDVMFRKSVDMSGVRPSTVACAPEHRQDDFSYFNSGVMVMNLPAMRETRGKLIQTLGERVKGIEPHNDQGILNAVYRDWARLPNAWNWKPYWGFSDDAAIVHFHGPKPGSVRRMMTGDLAPFPAAYSGIFRRCPQGYAAYLAEFDAFLNKAA
jgi:hypothetical protein